VKVNINLKGKEKFSLCCVYIAKRRTKLKIFILFLAKALLIQKNIVTLRQEIEKKIQQWQQQLKQSPR
jgi:hypothetical protein